MAKVSNGIYLDGNDTEMVLDNIKNQILYNKNNEV